MSYYDKTLKRTFSAYCVRGHLYDEKNTIVNGNGYPKCRECMYELQRKRRGV